VSGGPTLVILAAGMGSRYGGNKQLDAVGPGGATLMDYSVHDARRAGFTDLVFVIRPDMEEAFRPFVAARYGAGGGLAVRTAHQRLDDLPAGAVVPAGRTKPWGTAHAVLAAEAQVHGPFAVVNADDFYGAEAWSAVAGFLREAPPGTPTWAVVGYRLRDTVSEAGGVNRGACRTDAGGWLTGIDEVKEIVPAGTALTGMGPRGAVTLAGDSLVSMNMWAFTPVVFGLLREGLTRFLTSAEPLKGEYLLPEAVQDAVRSGAARVRVLDPGSRWFGVTYQADRPAVGAALRALVAAGRYPERLW
jgi:hypothetical protein